MCLAAALEAVEIMGKMGGFRAGGGVVGLGRRGSEVDNV
jgi:hypothetical protein